MKVCRSRGIALISALIVTAFLLALTGAFLSVNASHFAILRNSDNQSRARRAAQAGIEYALYNLEHERNWGVSESGDLPPRGGRGPGIAHGDFELLAVSGKTLLARFHPLNADVEITVENNLNAAMPVGNTAGGGNSGGAVPAEHALIKVKSQVTGARYEAEALVRLAPLYEDALYANGEIMIEGGQEFISASLDPFRNSIKATGDVVLPNISAGQTRFLTPDGSQFDDKGVLQANGRVRSYGAPASQRLTPSDIANTGGRILEEVDRKFSFYDLEPTDLPVAGEHDQEVVEVGSGEYRFTRARTQAEFTWTNMFGEKVTSIVSADIDVLEYYDDPGSDVPTKVFRSFSRLYDVASGTHVTSSTKFYYDDNTEVSVNDQEFVDAEIASFVVLDGGVPKKATLGEAMSSKVVINLDEQNFVVKKGTEVVPKQVPGVSEPSTLQVTNKPGIYAKSEGSAFVTPTIKLGSNGADVSIRAEGDIELSDAYTDGVGTLVSEQGNITLRPLADASFDVSSPSGGLALYAKKDVVIGNPDGADWNFNGFVFAGDDFLFDVNPKNDGNTYDVKFRGSVVAKNENNDVGSTNGIYIKDAGRIEMYYDPEYLKFLNRNLKGPDGTGRDIALEYLYRKI